MKLFACLVCAWTMGAALSDTMSFWKDDDASVTNREPVVSIKAETFRLFDMRFYDWSSVSLLRFSSFPMTGFSLFVK